MRISAAPVKRAIRRLLLRIGSRLSLRSTERVGSVHAYLDLGSWISSAGMQLPPDVGQRTDLFELALTKIDCSQPLYLEFGVFRGESLKWWAQHLEYPAARLVGFDSFQGLPEDWRSTSPAGYFATAGPPHIEDSRVSLQVGLFDETLPDFRLPEHDQLIINVDCDLYSSTKFVLESLRVDIREGTLIYFDELNDRDHEFRALREWSRASGISLKPLATADGGVRWLFEAA